MKNLLSLIIFALLLSVNVSAQGQKEEKKKKKVITEYSVSGVCGMCEKRIEKAALIKGVKMASWDKYTQKLSLIYNGTKVSGEEILASVAAAGYDSELIKADEDAYDALPDCCSYRREDLKVH